MSPAALAAGYLALRPTGGAASDAAYRTAAIDRGQITASVRATGTLTPVTTVVVGSMLSGQVVEILAARPQLQERLTEQIADTRATLPTMAISK